MPPKVIGPYRVLETIGSGGVGTVYRAIDKRSGEPIALKLLSTGPALDPKAARRLAREFETLATLSHPNVVRVFDTGVFQGYPYLAMELVEGLTLRPYLSLPSTSKVPLPPEPRTDDSQSFGGPSSDDSWDDDEDPPSKPFSLSAYNEEAPSHNASVDSGPESLRKLAEMAEEPDTQEI